VNHVAEVADAEGHHPDIRIEYNKVTFELFTHAVGGLSENDFIMATKIDKLFSQGQQQLVTT
jgi:4a-hydroxytetrahydrobiopterin dehydratase